MNPTQLSALLVELLSLPAETEWVEWKHNNDHPEMIAERISALANSAALHGRDSATWYGEWRISCPIEGWDGPKPERHHDFIDVEDFPTCWRQENFTVEVEAKAKEVAVLKLKDELKWQRKSQA